VRNWPGSAAGTGVPSGSARRIDEMVSLSRSIAVTSIGRNPGHAGGGTTAARPALPLPDPGSSRIARNDACRPGLDAGTRRARSTDVRG
jgi:hypothetical protein